MEEIVRVYHLLKDEPFPKRVHLKDGRTCDIPMRELVVVGVNYVDVGVQASGEAPGICETIFSFGHGDIVRVESLPTLSSPSSS